MDALRKQIQSLVDRSYFVPLFLDICNVKQILTMIVRMIVLSPIWFALISTRGITLDKLLLLRSSSFLHYIRGFWFQLSHVFIFESSQISEFSTDLQHSGLQNFKILGI